MEVALLSGKSLSNQMEKVMPAASLPAFWFVYSSFYSPIFFLAQQVKKSDRTRSGVPGADPGAVPVVEVFCHPARAEPAPACPAAASRGMRTRAQPAFHLSALCLKQ